MGAYSPVPALSDDMLVKINKMIVEPTLKGIQSEEMDYKGVIYFGIMVKDDIPYLLEYNVRFGDPETEVLLPALKTDLLKITTACISGKLEEVEFEFENSFFADVVLASGGYPNTYEKGFEIEGLNNVSNNALVFHAGTKKQGDKVVTNGGRVLNIVSKGNTLEEAIENAYIETDKISFDNMYFRKDIGKRTNKYLHKK
jgi:phosphoribosylamine--glycine ligase